MHFLDAANHRFFGFETVDRVNENFVIVQQCLAAARNVLCLLDERIAISVKFPHLAVQVDDRDGRNHGDIADDIRMVLEDEVTHAQGSFAVARLLVLAARRFVLTSM